MSKITFRADDDLIEELETFDASKSEVMREALREYLGGPETQASQSRSSDGVSDTETIDQLITERVDKIIADRLEGMIPAGQPQDVNVNITLDGERQRPATADVETSRGSEREGSDTDEVPDDTAARKTDTGGREGTDGDEHTACAQCGEDLGSDHVYCPNCGEKASRRVFCECGDELRSDWGFCPGCGRRTPAADVLDQT